MFKGDLGHFFATERPFRQLRSILKMLLIMKAKTVHSVYSNDNYTHINDWFYEGKVSKHIVQYLNDKNYKIIKDNSDNCKARGEDIIAVSPLGLKEVIEVKGYPTEFHTKGSQKGQPKPTKPKLQAKHWFSEVILSNIFNYSKHKGTGDFILALGFPKMDRYKELIKKVEDYFTDNNINVKIYLVDEEGNVTIDNLNVNMR